MSYNVTEKIRSEIAITFKVLYTWFGADDGLMQYIPANNGWTIMQNLEHVSLTNHYLLMLIKKGTAKAVEAAVKRQHTSWSEGYAVEWEKLEVIGMHGAFEWIRPEHMEPLGSISLYHIMTRLQRQEAECVEALLTLQDGEGVLYKTMMSVNGLGKIDVYHYILFLVQHIKRHIMQMQKVKLEFDQQ